MAQRLEWAERIVERAGAAGFSSFIVGGVGDSITGGAGTTSVNAFIGSMTVGGGAGAMSVQSAKGDVINSGTGTLLAFLNTDQTSQTINLGFGHGLATLQDVTVAGAAVKGSSTVSGFASATDIIGSSNSVDATGKFLGSSASDGAGGTLNVTNRYTEINEEQRLEWAERIVERARRLLGAPTIEHEPDDGG